MATLTMQPIVPSPTPSAQEDPRRVASSSTWCFSLDDFWSSCRSEKSSAEGGADLTDIDSGWVVLENSDIVSADLAAAAAARGGRGLGSSQTIRNWARWVLGGVVYTIVPFYDRVRLVEDETVGIVEHAVEVVEHIAEVTEKIAAKVADQLPEDGSLQKAAEKVEHIAELVDSDAEKVEAITEKIDKVSDEIDAAVRARHRRA